MIKKIAILTSGGDAPGMNSAISSVIKTAIANNIEAYVVYDGYKGLVENSIKKVDRHFADDILNRGGTIIGSSRLPEFVDIKVRKKAVANLKKLNIEGLVVIGGDGSYKGAEKLTKMGINCIGIPGTIDNDIVSTDFTIGFDTALNTVVTAIDAIRDTMHSHNRCGVVEIMGNNCGDLTLYAATATGAEIVCTKEFPQTIDEIVEQVKKLKDRKSIIITIAEKIYDINELVKTIQSKTGFETKGTVLGYIQRGGKPTAMERYWATRLGIFAVNKLINNCGGLYCGISGDKLVARNIENTLNMPKKDQKQEYEDILLINKCV